MNPPTLSWSSERTLRIDCGGEDSDAVAAGVLVVWRSLRDAAIPAMIDATPAYTTVQLAFDPVALDPEQVERAVQRILEALPMHAAAPPARTVTIPVCYHPEVAPDLHDVASGRGLTPEAVADLHASGTYRVRFLGFSPGFAYLSGLTPRLHTPRLDTPRTRVPPGSVGIAGAQTGVYPHALPGGWRLIGRTPLRLFDPDRSPPAALAPGDLVRFEPISLDALRAASSEECA